MDRKFTLTHTHIYICVCVNIYIYILLHSSDHTAHDTAHDDPAVINPSVANELLGPIPNQKIKINT